MCYRHVVLTINRFLSHHSRWYTAQNDRRKKIVIAKPWWFLSGLENLERSQLTGSWQMSWFSRRTRRITRITGLFVSLQALVEMIGEDYFGRCELHLRECSHWSQPEWLCERRVLVINQSFYDKVIHPFIRRSLGFQ